MGITTFISHQVLKTDPAFESVVTFGTRIETGGLAAHYAVGGAHEEAGWGWLEAMCRWAVC